jgi:hypothetical protein
MIGERKECIEIRIPTSKRVPPILASVYPEENTRFHAKLTIRVWNGLSKALV